MLGGPGEAVGEVCQPSDGRARKQVPARRLRPLLRRAHAEQGRSRQSSRVRALPQVDPRHGSDEHAIGAKGQYEVGLGVNHRITYQKSYANSSNKLISNILK